MGGQARQFIGQRSALSVPREKSFCKKGKSDARGRRCFLTPTKTGVAENSVTLLFCVSDRLKVPLARTSAAFSIYILSSEKGKGLQTDNQNYAAARRAGGGVVPLRVAVG